MAIWQFDMHCLPRSKVEARFGEIPLAISLDEYDTFDWWDNVGGLDALDLELDAILPRTPSWSDSVELRGEDDGNRIDVVKDSGELSDLFVRIDVRTLSLDFLGKVIGLAKKHVWMFLTQDGYILHPSLRAVLSAISRSDSSRFLEDPAGYCQTLGDQESD